VPEDCAKVMRSCATCRFHFTWEFHFTWDYDDCLIGWNCDPIKLSHWLPIGVLVIQDEEVE
jgi:hypothetical protein